MADRAPTVTVIGVPSSCESSSSIGRSVGSGTTMTSALPWRLYGTNEYRSIRSAGIDRNSSWSIGK